ncbi:PCNA [Choristoneura rosaceana nucleopolyhedrovirus]|uniref:PCNA n=1 Tax=Choristoneura rosaceana nucleopolyhedrovirus TaxID=58094 RepID=S5NA44_9ABAC|nr:PCNA [Choristoneura rosaceana nucleopolyhedrovirus]AGR57137.1 PCNA [Choristoneura rosaceana nucleopolyhedrovirus]
MEAVFASARAFQNIVDALRGILSHATFDCDAKGVSVQGMDAERVALVELRLNRAGFARYECERKVSFSVPVRGLVKIVHAADPRKKLAMRASARDDRLHFEFESAPQRTVACALAQISLDVERLGVPDNEHDCVLAVSSDEYAKVCRDLMRLGATSVEVSCGAAGLRFTADASDGVHASVLLRAPPQRQLTQVFACRYLNAFARAWTLSKYVDVCMTADTPLRLRFCIGLLGTLDLYLAPQMRIIDVRDSQ